MKMCYNFYLVFYRLFVIRFTSYFGLRFAFSVSVSAVILFIIPQIFCGLLRKPELVKIPLLGLCSCFAYFHQELCYFYLSIPTSGFWLYVRRVAVSTIQPPAGHCSAQGILTIQGIGNTLKPNYFKKQNSSSSLLLA